MGKGKGVPPPVPQSGKGPSPIKTKAAPKPPSPNDELMLQKVFDKMELNFSFEDEATEAGLEAYDGPTVNCPRCEKDIREYMMDTHWQSHSTEIEPRLFLGARRNVENIKELLERTKITHVLNVAIEVGPLIRDLDGKIVKKDMPFHDLGSQDLEHIPEITAYMNEVLEAPPPPPSKKGGEQENRLLVQCVQGISRSATVMIAFLMEYRGLSLREAYNLLKKKRPIIDPRPEFIKYLGTMEMRLRKCEKPSLTPEEVVGQRIKIAVDEAPKVGRISQLVDQIVELQKDDHWLFQDLKSRYRFINWDLKYSLLSKDPAHEDLFATMCCYQLLRKYGFRYAPVTVASRARRWIVTQARQATSTASGDDGGKSDHNDDGDKASRSAKDVAVKNPEKREKEKEKQLKDDKPIPPTNIKNNSDGAAATATNTRNELNKRTVNLCFWDTKSEQLWENVFGIKREKRVPRLSPSDCVRGFSRTQTAYNSWTPERIGPLMRSISGKHDLSGDEVRRSPPINTVIDAERWALAFHAFYGTLEIYREYKEKLDAEHLDEEADALMKEWFEDTYDGFVEQKRTFTVEKVEKRICEGCRAMYTGEVCHCTKAKQVKQVVDTWAEWRDRPARSIRDVPWDEIRQMTEIKGSSGTGGVTLCAFDDGLLALKSVSSCMEFYADDVFRMLGIGIVDTRVISQYRDPEEYFEFFQTIDTRRQLIMARQADMNIPSTDEDSDMSTLLLGYDLRKNEFFKVLEVPTICTVPGEHGLFKIPIESLPRYFYNIGELAFGDCIINNLDRFPLGTLWKNEGNLSNALVTSEKVVGIDQAIQPIRETASGFRSYMDGLSALFKLDSAEFKSFVAEKMRTAFQLNCAIEPTSEHMDAFAKGFFETRMKCMEVDWDEFFISMEKKILELFDQSEVDIGQGRLPEATAFLRHTIALTRESA